MEDHEHPAFKEGYAKVAPKDVRVGQSHYGSLQGPITKVRVTPKGNVTLTYTTGHKEQYRSERYRVWFK